MIPDGAIVAHHQLLSYASALGQSGVHLTVDLSTRFPADTAPAFISVAAFTNLTFAPVKMPVAMWADQFAQIDRVTVSTNGPQATVKVSLGDSFKFTAEVDVFHVAQALIAVTSVMIRAADTPEWFALDRSRIVDDTRWVAVGYRGSFVERSAVVADAKHGEWVWDQTREWEPTTR
jgi:hypothetical protein